jgi:hypothetical protein
MIHHDPSSTEVSRLLNFEKSKALSTSFQKKSMDMMELYGMDSSHEPSHSTELLDFLND